jgi:hypothetical protein
MNDGIDDEGLIELTARQRRRFFQLAAAGAGALLLPRWALSARNSNEPLGAQLRQCCSDGRFADVAHTHGAQGQFRLALLSASTRIPLALAAKYTNHAQHRFWQAARAPHGIHASPPTAIRWFAQAGSGLPLVVTCAGLNQTLQVPAQSGRYVLAIGASAAAWDRHALRGGESGCGQVELVCRNEATPADFPYVVFSVEPIAV